MYRATLDDIPFLVNADKVSFDDEGARWDENTYERGIEQKEKWFLLIDDNKRGFILATHQPGSESVKNTIYVSKICVLPSYRRMGVATKMIDYHGQSSKSLENDFTCSS